MEVTGRVYVMGNEPFTQTAIEADGGKVYALLGKYDQELRRLQNKRVTVRGIPTEAPRFKEAIEVQSYQIAEPK
jgi:hypothetical protein